MREPNTTSNPLSLLDVPADAERWIRRDERRLLARMVRQSMTAEQLRQLSKSDQRLLALLAQSLLQAIAEREAA